MDIQERLTAFAMLGATWVMWLLVLLSIVGLAIVLERAYYFFATRDDAVRVKRELLALLGKKDVEGARKLLGTSRSFEARIAGSDGARTYLRTGDTGFLWETELFVTGRLKDVVIVRGRNYAAPGLERTLEGAHPALRPGGLVAVEDPLAEGLVVLAELTRPDASASGAKPP